METFKVDRRGRVVVVTLDHPPVNAVNRRMQVQLEEVFAGFDEDASVGAVVLAAHGERAFCGGIDLKETSSDRGAATMLRDRLNPGWQWRQTQHAIRHCPVPVIAAVEAPAIGAGFGLIGVCDLIVASTSASFALTEINVGLLGGASKALHLVGPHKARMMMFTGQRQSAEEMYRLGAVERLVEPGEALAVAVQIAQEIAQKSPMAVRLAKESILRIETDRMEDQYRTEWDYTNRLGGFNDSREAMSAHLENREPAWTWT